MNLRPPERYATSLAWKGTPYIVWDTEQEGFGVHVWNDGNRRGYVVQIKRDGKSQRKALGRIGEIKCEAAREAAARYRGAVKDGRDPRAEDKAKRTAWTLQDAFDYFAGSYAQQRKLSAEYKVDSGKLFDHHTPNAWKSTKLTGISRQMVVTRHGAITGGISNTKNNARGGIRRANAWLSLMSRLFTLGIQEGHCAVNPAVGIKKNEETERERFLSEVELRTLWSYLDKHENVEAAACVQFILLTGCRPREAYTMEWSHLNKDTWQWTKPPSRTKRRKVHRVMLTSKAIAVRGRLDTWKRSKYVFPSPADASEPRSDKLKSFWCVTRKQCALPDVRLYDCRHSFASWLAMGGATELEIAAQLGHNNVQTTRRYVHIAQESLRQKADIMGDVIDRVTDISQEPIVSRRDRRGVLITRLDPQTLQSFDGED